MEIITLSLFCAILIFCIILNISIIYAMVAGLVIFCIYAKLKRYSWAQLFEMMLSGIKTAKSILIVFILIGMLTALWRACGTVPTIICYAALLISPGTFILMAFLLNCAISMITGTSFGTAATMGVICMTTAVSMGINPIFVGGAILSGVYFGDRCSPVSTSALLVSELTGTNIFDNIKKMLRTALAPFLLTGAVYAIMGFSTNHAGIPVDLRLLFGRAINLHWSTLLPAVIILVLSVLRINVKITMSVSIIAAIFICLFVQHIEVTDILRFMVTGYSSSDQEIRAVLSGGGILSMLKVAAIVCISSSYAGIFKKTELLNDIKKQFVRLSEKITPFGGTFVASIFAAMIACNQTLTIMLTHQICNDTDADPQTLAIDLENTAVVIAPLIPWSIAGVVPLASVGAPTASLLAACFLYLLPAYTFLRHYHRLPLK